MNNSDIIAKFTAATRAGEIVWNRNIKTSSDSRLNVSYTCDFIEGEKVEIAPTRYIDSTTLRNKYSYRLSFFDQKNYCYKSISPKDYESDYYALEQLFNLIEEKMADLDNKLSKFFSR